MYGWALAFLIIAVAEVVFGFTGVATGSATIAKAVFGVALMIAVVGTIVAVVRRHRPR